MNRSEKWLDGERTPGRLVAVRSRDEAELRGAKGATRDSISRQAIIRAYRRYAPIYDWLFGAILKPGRRALTAAVHDLEPKSVLEVGVGTGLTLGDYPSECRLVGIDLCEEMLSLARDKAEKLRPRKIEFEAMDAESMSYPNGTFDCVTVPYVLSVTPHPERLVAEIRRVCRRGGTIIILNHFSGSRFWRLFEAVVRTLAERVGFRSDFAFAEHVLGHPWEIISVRKVNLFGLSKLVTIRNV
jgi:phosphatidylethanolamine/phosphatidyl-N-methylethanolamine N-methyltransferase